MRRKSVDGLDCDRCAPLRVPAFKGNVLCEDGVRRDLCEGHYGKVQQVAGGKAQNKGEDFESFVEGQLDEALRLGIVAHWIHNQPTAKIINGRLMWTRPGVADYTAVSFDRAMTIAAEAKCYKHRLLKSKIEPKQQRHLDAVVLGGGLAFLLVRITDGPESVTSAIPWQSVPWTVAKSVESVTAKEILSWRIMAGCWLESFCPVRGKPAAVGRRVFPRE